MKINLIRSLHNHGTLGLLSVGNLSLSYVWHGDLATLYLSAVLFQHRRTEFDAKGNFIAWPARWSYHAAI